MLNRLMRMKIKPTYIAILVIICIAVAGYYFYYRSTPSGPQQNATTKFEQYAQTLGMNVTQFRSCMESGKYKSDIQNDIADGVTYGVQATPTFFINGKELEGALPIADFQTAIEVQIANGTQNQLKTGTNPPQGATNASAVIVMFSDYQCPYCKMAEPTVKQVVQQNQGKVVLYYRDFPLPIHLYAENAAEASRCAGEQGKYWEYHDMLFEKQDEWSSG
jgi:protein-disulfide isomerase